MDTAILVDDAIDAGREVLARLARAGFPVEVAFWVMPPEDEDRSDTFYIASPEVDRVGDRDAFGLAWSAVGILPDGLSSHGSYRLVSPADPAAKAASTVRGRHPGSSPIRYRNRSLGNLRLREAYIYPRIDPDVRRDLATRAVDALLKLGPATNSTIVLRDQSQLSAQISGLRNGRNGLEVLVSDPATGTERAVHADDIVNIL